MDAESNRKQTGNVTREWGPSTEKKMLNLFIQTNERKRRVVLDASLPMFRGDWVRGIGWVLGDTVPIPPPAFHPLVVHEQSEDSERSVSPRRASRRDFRHSEMIFSVDSDVPAIISSKSMEVCIFVIARLTISKQTTRIEIKHNAPCRQIGQLLLSSSNQGSTHCGGTHVFLRRGELSGRHPPRNRQCKSDMFHVQSRQGPPHLCLALGLADALGAEVVDPDRRGPRDEDAVDDSANLCIPLRLGCLNIARTHGRVT